MILIDTQILLWATTRSTPHKLGRAAMRVFDGAADDGFFVSAVSIWEVAQKSEKGGIEIGEPISAWYDRVRAVHLFNFLPLTPEVALSSRTRLADFGTEDPADRFIVATAIVNGLDLLTTDGKMLAFPAALPVTLDPAAT